MKRNMERKEMMEGWALGAMMRWQDKLFKLKIVDTGRLAASFRKSIIEEAGGDVMKAQFLYLAYGEMVDMGVGKGTKLGQTAEGLQGRAQHRAARKWYSKTFYSQVLWLGEMMAHEYGIEAALMLSVNEKIEI